MKKILFIYIIFFSCNNDFKRVPDYELLINLDTSSVFQKFESQLKSNLVNTNTTEDLKFICKLWGFLKYHHPSIRYYSIPWDNQLFYILDKYLSEPNSEKRLLLVESWVESLGIPPKRNKKVYAELNLKMPPDYSGLFGSDRVNKNLLKKLEYVRDNEFASSTSDSYSYVHLGNRGNPEFKNEVDYPGVPNAMIRLLSLFRYWNMIQYYYPYRYLLDNWDNMLDKYIPIFLQARDNIEYKLAVLKLITNINDSHAGFFFEDELYDSYFGKYLIPFEVNFIENHLIVTENLSKVSVKRGDIVRKINGIPIDSLIHKNDSLTPASNYNRKLFNMTHPVWGSLYRSKSQKFALEIERNKKIRTLTFERALCDSTYKKKHQSRKRIAFRSYEIFKNNIGYILCSKLTTNDFEKIRSAFKNTKGLIIDLREYPSVFMPYEYAKWLKQNRSPFAKISIFDTLFPGKFNFKRPLNNGPDTYTSKFPQEHPIRKYSPKIVILVNSQTISQGEFTCMAFDSENATIIGSTTAGADGDVSEISLPGGIHTFISGTGIYYPDGQETQRVGVRIDVYLAPTIKAVKEGKDELVQYAIKLLSR